jgi:hypothetical protein
MTNAIRSALIRTTVTSITMFLATMAVLTPLVLV